MLSKKTNLILHTLVLGLSANIACMEVEEMNTPHALVANPVQHLNKMHTTIHEFQNDQLNLQTTKKSYSLEPTTLAKKYKSLVQKHEQICPLFLLGECTKEEDSTKNDDICLLSRTYKPHFRASFEQHTSQLLIKKLQASPTTPIIYTSFASGGTFQDLVIVTKALIMQPKARLNIHLIDGSNTPYVSAIDFLNYSREITTDQTSFSFESRLAEYEQYARNKEKNDLDVQAMTHQELQQQLILLCLEKEAQYKQFISWLTQKFPLAQISLYIHDRINNYCNFLEKNNSPHADILSTADIDDGESMRMGSLNDYAQLCIETLKNKPTSNNAWLIKTPHGAAISTARLPESTNATKIWFDCKDL